MRLKRKSNYLHATPPTLFSFALPPSYPQLSFFFLNLILMSLHFPPTNPIAFHCIKFRVFKNISNPSSPHGQGASRSSPYTFSVLHQATRWHIFTLVRTCHIHPDPLCGCRHACTPILITREKREKREKRRNKMRRSVQFSRRYLTGLDRSMTGQTSEQTVAIVVRYLSSFDCLLFCHRRAWGRSCVRCFPAAPWRTNSH